MNRPWQQIQPSAALERSGVGTGMKFDRSAQWSRARIDFEKKKNDRSLRWQIERNRRVKAIVRRPIGRALMVIF